ncbi:hypothetical protein KKG58_05355 [Patescibacteria group bacterium]|nr:hypothetical protein [Patescibacteria group bacterium]
MKKSWNLTEKILAGEKKIESRWYKSKCSPWGKIKENDIKNQNAKFRYQKFSLKIFDDFILFIFLTFLLCQFDI